MSGKPKKVFKRISDGIPIAELKDPEARIVACDELLRLHSEKEEAYGKAGKHTLKSRHKRYKADISKLRTTALKLRSSRKKKKNAMEANNNPVPPSEANNNNGNEENIPPAESLPPVPHTPAPRSSLPEELLKSAKKYGGVTKQEFATFNDEAKDEIEQALLEAQIVEEDSKAMKSIVEQEEQAGRTRNLLVESLTAQTERKLKISRTVFSARKNALAETTGGMNSKSDPRYDPSIQMNHVAAATADMNVSGANSGGEGGKLCAHHLASVRNV